MKIRNALLALPALALGACSPAHIDKYTPKHREYELPAATGSPDKPDAAGSLWRDGRAGSMLFTDARALRENDLVVVKVEEVANARRSTDTGVKRQSETDVKLSAFVSAIANLNLKDVDAKASSGSGTLFTGQGSTSRDERLTATVPALVRKVLPNGNLFIEGHRVVLVNSEEHHFYISGVVRPIDIDQENAIKSSMIADAEIEFTGRGVLTDNQRQGFFSRYFGWIWPF